MHAESSGKYKKYACGKRLAGAVNRANATRRPLHGINRDVVAALRRLVSSEHFEAALAEQLAADRSNVEQRRLEYPTAHGALQAQRAKLQKKVTNLLGELEDLEDPEVRAETRKRMDKLCRDCTEVDRQLARLVEPREPSAEDIAALRAEAGRMTALLEGALTNDPAEAQLFFADVLDGPIVATPIEVNGEPRFLLRGTLRTAPPHLVARAAIQGGATTVNSDGVKKVGDGRGMARRTIRREVTVRSRWAARAVTRAEEVDRTQRAEVWGRWLAEGRYRSRRELARACGVSASLVTRVLGGR